MNDRRLVEADYRRSRVGNEIATSGRLGSTAEWLTLTYLEKEK